MGQREDEFSLRGTCLLRQFWVHPGGLCWFHMRGGDRVPAIARQEEYRGTVVYDPQGKPQFRFDKSQAMREKTVCKACVIAITVDAHKQGVVIERHNGYETDKPPAGF